MLLTASPPDPVVAVRDRARLAAEKVRLGDALFRLDDLRGACREYQKAIEILPTWWMPRLTIVRCGRYAGLPIDRLIEHAEFAVKARPQIPMTHVYYGIALEEAGRDTAAIAAYEGALRRHPLLIDARYRLGCLLAQHGQLRAARRHLERVLEVRSSHMVARVRLTEVYEQLGLFDLAEKGHKDRVNRSRYPARALSALVRFYNRTGKKKQAKRARQLYQKRFGR